MSKKKIHIRHFIGIVSLAIASSTISGALFLESPAQASAKSSKSSSDNDGIDASVRTAINQGQWADAIQKLEQLSSGDTVPGRNEAWLAFAYLYTGKHNELKDLDKRVQAMPANDKDPNAAPIVHAFALTLQSVGPDRMIIQGKFDEAEKLLAGLAEDKNGDALLEFAKACVALKKGNSQQAAEYCEKVVGLCPHFAWGYRTLGFIQDKSLKNPQLAETAYAKAVAIEPGFRDVRTLLVDLRLAKNDFDGAIASSQEAIKLFPRDANNYYRLSQIYLQQWRLIEALEQLKKAVSLDANDPRFYRAMATIYRQQGKLEDAITEQMKAVNLSKDKAFELNELANLQELNQNVEAAIASLQSALKEAPTNTVSHQKLVQLLKKEGRKDDLIAEYKREVDLQAKFEPLRLSLADAYKQAGKPDEAVEQLKEAANLDQRDPRPHREIAKIELAKKNFSAAAKSYTRALNINPASVDDLVALGFCYANNCDYMQAETAFTTGLALQQLGQTSGAPSTVNPNDIMRSLASVLFTEGRYREAVVTLEAVVASDKDSEQKKLDQFNCSQGKALRDRNADTLKELQTSYAAFDKTGQLNNLPSYIDTLNLLGKKDLANETLKKFQEAELKDKAPLVLANSWLWQDRSKEARDLINKVIDNSKNDAEQSSAAYITLAHAFLKEADRKSAIDALLKATESNPKDFNAHVELGRLYLGDKKITEAQQSAARAMEINPYSVPALVLVGDSYLAQEKWKDAEANFLKATDLYPTSVEAHKGLLSAYEKQSKTQDAQREKEIISNLSKNS